MLRRSAALVLALTCALAAVADAVANDRDEFSVRDVDGPNAFTFDGFVGVGATTVPVAAVGRFVADGRGHITDGVRTLVVGGNAVRQTFTCTYAVNPNGTGNAECTVTTGAVVNEETFDFVIVERKKKAFFTATTPGATIRGVTRLQR